MSSQFFARLGARRWFGAALVVSAGLLAACGGGGQIDPFKPTRILAFGDELSLIEADGRKYSINAFKITDATTTPPTESTTEIDCTRNPLWIQTVAVGFGLAFDRCLGAATAASGQILAQAGHKVANFEAQIAAVQGNALGEKDLALVMIGMHDILELYAQFPGVDSVALLGQAAARGTAYGQQINTLALRGPAVVVLTVPDLGLTPFALAQNTLTGDPLRAALLTAMTEAFNDSMSVALINDGRLIGLVFADLELQRMVKSPASFGLTDVIAPACKDTAPLPGCTTATLAEATATAAAATTTTWLWADSLRLSPAGQARLGLLAESRARSNPF